MIFGTAPVKATTKARVKDVASNSIVKNKTAPKKVKYKTFQISLYTFSLIGKVSSQDLSNSVFGIFFRR